MANEKFTPRKLTVVRPCLIKGERKNPGEVLTYNTPDSMDEFNSALSSGRCAEKLSDDQQEEITKFQKANKGGKKAASDKE